MTSQPRQLPSDFDKKILLFNRKCPKKYNSKLKLRKNMFAQLTGPKKVVFSLYFNKNFMTSQSRKSPSNFDKKKKQKNLYLIENGQRNTIPF